MISEYSAFYPISLGDLHPEIQPFKRRGENQAGSPVLNNDITDVFAKMWSKHFSRSIKSKLGRVTKQSSDKINGRRSE